MNFATVAWFGKLEFWFALVKVGALVRFLIIGLILLVSGQGVAGVPPGLHMITGNGGIFPHGVLPAIVTVEVVIIAYAGSRSPVPPRTRSRTHVLYCRKPSIM